MRRVLLRAIPLIAIGSVVVALPDDGRRLFSISRDHGPSAVDGVGIALLLLGWALVVGAVWSRRRRVYRRLGASGTAAAVAALGIGITVVGWSVTGDHGAWWMVGVVVAAAPQVAAAIAAR